MVFTNIWNLSWNKVSFSVLVRVFLRCINTKSLFKLAYKCDVPSFEDPGAVLNAEVLSASVISSKQLETRDGRPVRTLRCDRPEPAYIAASSAACSVLRLIWGTQEAQQWTYHHPASWRDVAATPPRCPDREPAPVHRSHAAAEANLSAASLSDRRPKGLDAQTAGKREKFCQVI